MKKYFFNKYKYKIVTKEKLKKILNTKLKNKKSILCHGVFDVVHPGHVRHLAYAKSKADILIVSLTSDRHISKGTYRPHVPENLRALNIAVFEMVDYVIIDKNKTPLNNIEFIKPNFFAKGFEYSSKNMPKATKDEINVLNKYGGKIIFTPGDIVYSSSNILSNELPNIDYEKLYLIMEKNKITFDSLVKSLKNLKKFHVFVLGDTIVDTYTRTTLIGGQTKTPTFSVLYNSKENYVGGAGIVAKHLKSAGAKVTLCTVLGNDELKKFVTKDLENNKINLNVITDNSRPTTNKNAIIADNYRLLKVDTLDNSIIADSIIKKISNNIKKSKANAFAFCDFRHGIFNSNNIEKFSKNIPKNSFKVADSQVASRWGNICDFNNFDLITPNEREARFSLADQDSTIGELSKKLFEKTNCNNLILKLGFRGSLSVHKDKNNYQNGNSIPSFSKNVIDPVGAGDAYLAYATLMMLETKNLLKSSIIGSIAAACECEKDGNEPITINLIEEKINIIKKSLI